MRPKVKKWIATTSEIAMLFTFTGTGFLFGDDIKSIKNVGIRNAPFVLWLWISIGLLYFLCRWLAARYAREESLNILSAPGFIEKYRKMLDNAIDLLAEMYKEGVRNQQQLMSRAEVTLLNVIAKTVLYFRNATAGSSAPVNCVLMRSEPFNPTQHLTHQVLGLEPGGERHLIRVLKIERMSREELEVPATFLLPVYDPNGEFRNKMLFGAPKAFATGENQIIDDTTSRSLYKGNISGTVKNELKKYFKKRKKTLRSFASMPVMFEQTPIAVVNVHCREKRIFGRQSLMLIDFLVPFLTILAYIYEEKEKRGR